MLAPSYRRQTKRERGISLSRTSSQQKFYHSTNSQLVHQLNQSFQCHEPSFYPNNQLNSSALKQLPQNRMSLIPQKQKQKYKTYRQQKSQTNVLSHHNRKQSALETSSKSHIITDPSSFLNIQQQTSFSHQTQSLHQMIDLLTEYQKSCQEQMDLESAEQARKRINQLKIQSINTRRKELEVEGKQYVIFLKQIVQTIKTRRQGQVEKRQFYEFWNNKILEARQALKQIEHKHLQQQNKQLVEFQNCVRSQPNPLIKYSSKVLEIRRNLTSLIKSRKYKQAEHLKELLAKRECEEQEKWLVACQEKKLVKIRQFKKKQLVELEAFKLKLNSSFNQLLKQKEKQQERMIKKMKKMQVQAKKMPSAIIKAKKDLLNQSKANIQNEEY